MTRGLLVHKRYILRMLAGRKAYEYRGKKCGFLHERIELLNGGYSYGWVVFSASIPKKTGGVPGWAWRIRTVKKYGRPKKYPHPNGAQVWVKDVFGKV